MNDNEARTPNDVEREALNAEAIAESEKELPPLIVNGIDTMAAGRIAYAAGYIAGALRRSKEPEWEYGAQHSQGTNAHPSRKQAEEMVAWHAAGDDRKQLHARGKTALVRRRKAGPWVPVKQEGAEQ